MICAIVVKQHIHRLGTGALHLYNETFAARAKAISRCWYCLSEHHASNECASAPDIPAVKHNPTAHTVHRSSKVCLLFNRYRHRCCFMQNFPSHPWLYLTVIDNWKILFLATFEAASVFGLPNHNGKRFRFSCTIDKKCNCYPVFALLTTFTLMFHLP